MSNRVNIIGELELSENINELIAIYPGRFQPMGRHHFEVYKWLKNKFGNKNTYIATSNKTNERSPFTFTEKVRIMKAGYGIDEVMISYTQSPYRCDEILENYDDENTACVFCVGSKDYDRISFNKKDGTPAYLQPYTENIAELKPISEHAYVILAPHFSIEIEGFGEMSGTTIRQALGAGKIDLFQEIMGWYNSDIAKFMFERLNDEFRIDVHDFIVNNDVVPLINEVSSTAGSGGEQDDGPRFMIGNMATFSKMSQDTATKLGYSVIDYILSGQTEFEIYATEPPNGQTTAVSYFKVGVATNNDEFDGGTNYEPDHSSKTAYLKWSGELEDLAKTLGMKLIDYLGATRSVKQAPKQDTFKE